MAIGGEGMYMVSVLWSLTALVLVFLVLRAYTRLVCVASYGIDDHFYAMTCVLVVAYSSTMQVAAEHGYGQSNLDPQTRTDANYWRTIGQTFSLMSTGTSKASVGLFLLRLTVIRWQRIAIWFLIAFMMTAATLATIFTWAACRPFAYTWDDRIEGGQCLNTVPLSMILALSTIGVDLFFAILPWLFIWKLNSPRREKIIIAASLSLGIFAAAAGVKRIMEVKGVRDVPVGVIVWSMTETSATLICIGIPVCRPLWTRMFKTYLAARPSKSSSDQAPQNGNPAQPIGLNTFGGSPMPGAKGVGGAKKKNKASSLFSRLTAASTINRGYDHMTDGQSEQVILDRGAGSKDGSAKDFRASTEIEEQERNETQSRNIKRSWIIGESLSQNEVLCDGPQKEHKEDGIMTTKSYKIQRVDSPV
ncbi:putative Integral membrane protein [Seiridium unicorne]|uniref:Integral membrane protein n=1 Tax=Seiridium unicorne TaxID=138068 RepID=A0ABR2UFN1_9PEZI